MLSMARSRTSVWSLMLDNVSGMKGLLNRSRATELARRLSKHNDIACPSLLFDYFFSFCISAHLCISTNLSAT